MTYVDGFVLPVPKKNIEQYRQIAQKAGAVWMKHGALAYRECVAEDTEDKGFCKTFPAIADPAEGDTVVFAYIVFKSRQHRDEVNAKVMEDPALKEMCDEKNMPFDCKKMAYGGFETIVDFS